MKQGKIYFYPNIVLCALLWVLFSHCLIYICTYTCLLYWLKEEGRQCLMLSCLVVDFRCCSTGSSSFSKTLAMSCPAAHVWSPPPFPPFLSLPALWIHVSGCPAKGILFSDLWCPCCHCASSCAQWHHPSNWHIAVLSQLVIEKRFLKKGFKNQIWIWTFLFSLL